MAEKAIGNVLKTIGDVVCLSGVLAVCGGVLGAFTGYSLPEVVWPMLGLGVLTAVIGGAINFAGNKVHEQ